MSREERAREAEEQAQDVAIGLPVDEELRLAFENRPERLHDLEWDAFAARAVEVEERVRQLFEEMDRNHDGVLSAAEVGLAMRRSGLNVTDEQAALMIGAVDLDASATVSLPEFRRMVWYSPGLSLDTRDFLANWQAFAANSDHLGDAPPRTGFKSHSAPPFSSILLAGAVAGATSRTITAPVDRIKVLLQAGASLGGEKVTSISQAARLIHKEAGLRAFFRGNLVNCLKIAPENATKFVCYDFAKDHLVADKNSMNAMERFLCGALAGVCSSMAVYPLEVLKTRLAVTPEAFAGRGLIGSFLQIAREGPAMLYKGLFPSLLGVVPYAGVDLSLYFTMRSKYMELNPQKEPPPLVVLSMGAMSSFCGQSVAYPLQLARTRIQLGKGNGTLQVWRSAIKEGGVKSLWRGFGPNALKALPAVSISYVVFESVIKMTK